ncbi:MAG: DUF427 domain-containing protein [Gymnodinialimonas sp.]
MEEETVLAVESVQDYPRPPALEPVAQRLRAVFKGVPVADSEAGLRVLETHHAPTYYIPPADVLGSALVPVAHETFCEWKGRAVYYDLVINGRRARKAAWSYPAPTARFEALRDYVAFYATSLDEAFVGSVRVVPQPGDFYGGWVTPNLTGRIKGAMGTLHW